MRAEGGSDYAAQEQLAQAVLDEAVELDDRAPTGTRPADWQAVLLEALGDAAPVMVAAERAGHGWPVVDWITKASPSRLEGARDRLVEFAASCVGAIAAVAPSDAPHVQVEISSFWDDVELAIAFPLWAVAEETAELATSCDHALVNELVVRAGDVGKPHAQSTRST